MNSWFKKCFFLLQHKFSLGLKAIFFNPTSKCWWKWLVFHSTRSGDETRWPCLGERGLQVQEIILQPSCWQTLDSQSYWLFAWPQFGFLDFVSKFTLMILFAMHVFWTKQQTRTSVYFHCILETMFIGQKCSFFVPFCLPLWETPPINIFAQLHDCDGI